MTETAKVSKLYLSPDGWRFCALVDQVREYLYLTKKEANKNRASLIKQLKMRGHRVEIG